MLRRQKIATVSGLLGSLAMIYVGAANAYADGPKGECTMNADGDVVCVLKGESVHNDRHGKYYIKQTRDCQTVDRPRLVFPDEGFLNNSATTVGPKVECSNKAKMPKSFKMPRIEF